MLVGREGEIVELSALLQATDVRLVTLTGPGGSGKTRLSIGLADRLASTAGRFPDGVYFVPLAEVTEARGAGRSSPTQCRFRRSPGRRRCSSPSSLSAGLC